MSDSEDGDDYYTLAASIIRMLSRLVFGITGVHVGVIRTRPDSGRETYLRAELDGWVIWSEGSLDGPLEPASRARWAYYVGDDITVRLRAANSTTPYGSIRIFDAIHTPRVTDYYMRYHEDPAPRWARTLELRDNTWHVQDYSSTGSPMAPSRRPLELALESRAVLDLAWTVL